MKKLFILLTAVILSACTPELNCPNGKIVGHSNIQGSCFITLDNGNKKYIPCTMAEFDKYPSNTCYEGVK